MNHPHPLLVEALPDGKAVREAADAVGLTPQYLGQVRAGYRALHAKTAAKLAEHLRGKGHAVTAAQILGIDGTGGATKQADLVALRAQVDVALSTLTVVRDRLAALAA